MPAPEFQWKSYDVPGAARGLRTREAKIELPDLGAWPAPLDKAEILLESAAEVEHALMVQYLYAAYSLKSSEEVTDAGHQAALNETDAESWPRIVVGIAREEMGHLMTVQNLLALLDLPPNFEREDFPPRKDLYPFSLHLEPLSQRSLAKYVVAEAPAGAEGIEDIIELARESAGTSINRVGVLYGLLGLVFSAEEQVKHGGGSDSTDWDEAVSQLATTAYRQSPAATWHLPEEVFDASTGAQQADPQDWQVGNLRVHRVVDRAGAVAAIRDIGEQGEGPTSAGALSHYERFLGIFRGRGDVPPFPADGGSVTHDVPTDPSLHDDLTDVRTRRWGELADLRYGLLLGFVEHYLLSAGDDRGVLTGWIFGEMRSRLGSIARRLTTMPRGTGGTAGAPFTLPSPLHLPGAETARWRLHADRTRAAIAKVEEMTATDPSDASDPFLTALLASDRARVTFLDARAAGQPVPTSFLRDILPLFRPDDIKHMADLELVDLATYEGVRAKAGRIATRVKQVGPRQMPPPPDAEWTAAQNALFDRWIAEDFPP